MKMDVNKRKEYDATYYRKNKVSMRKKRNKKRHDAKQLLVEYKGGKCEICGYVDKCLTVYDFHHRTGVKEFDIAKGVAHHYSIERLIKEVDKCILVCSNCHRKIHFINIYDESDTCKNS